MGVLGTLGSMGSARHSPTLASDPAPSISRSLETDGHWDREDIDTLRLCTGLRGRELERASHNRNWREARTREEEKTQSETKESTRETIARD